MTVARQIHVDDVTSATFVDAVPCALVIGNFDGVHKGHQAVLEQAVAEARAVPGWLACALTFEPHPAEVVGFSAPPLLTPMPERVALMGALGVDRVYVRHFDTAFAASSPERFASELVAATLLAKVVVIGENFRFGAKRAGDLSLLRALGYRLGFDVRVAAVASDAEGPYSSTRVRDALAAGNLDAVRTVLGRPHAISGTVVHGNARGATIGFPTANLEGIVEMLPADGVYAVIVERLDNARLGAPGLSLAPAVANIGVRPTVGGGARTVEAHLLGYSGDLYGARLRLRLLARLRDEKKFSSLDELKVQIARDAAHALSVLGAESP